VLAERGAEGFGVVDEDVDPDARIRAGHAGHVPQRAAGREERIVPVDARCTGLVDEQVRERVGKVAREGHEPVVGIGSTATGVAPRLATKPWTSR